MGFYLSLTGNLKSFSLIKGTFKIIGGIKKWKQKNT